MINESAASPILFHYTNSIALANILRTNQFHLTTNAATDADRLSDHYYYLSMTRTRLGKYHKGIKNTGAVLLTLDGNKLNQRYKTRAIDYFGEDFRKHYKGDYEQEDRLFSNDAVIDNARSYIINVDILQPDGDDLYDGYKLALRQILILCGKYKIQCHIYTQYEDWLISNKRKSVKANIKSLFNVGPKRKDWEYLDRDITKKEYLDHNKLRRSSRIDDVLELYRKNKLEDLGARAKSTMRKIVYDHMNEQFIQLQNDVHNKRSGGAQDRASVDKVIDVLKREKLTLRGLHDFIINKWRPIYQASFDAN